jgi:F-type H+-transporting ATPase subunit beta
MSAGVEIKKYGKIKQVIGPVVDVEFDSENMPAIFHAVRVSNTSIN